MLGFPVEDDELFRGFVHDVARGRQPCTRRSGRRASSGSTPTSTPRSSDHRDDPRDDLTTYLLDVELDGQKLSATSTSRGIDRAAADRRDRHDVERDRVELWHLAPHPDDRQRLVDEPELMPIAIEELLRAYAPVTMARMVAKDHDFHGCPMKKDDWVLLPFPAANRDPELVRAGRRGRPRPPGEPPRRVRARHPPLPRLQPGPARGAGRRRGVRRALPATSSWPARRRAGASARSAAPASCPSASSPSASRRHHPIWARTFPNPHLGADVPDLGNERAQIGRQTAATGARSSCLACSGLGSMPGVSRHSSTMIPLGSTK